MHSNTGSVALRPSLVPAKSVIIGPQTALIVGARRYENPTDYDLEVTLDPRADMGASYLESLVGGERNLTIVWVE